MRPPTRPPVRTERESRVSSDPPSSGKHHDQWDPTGRIDHALEKLRRVETEIKERDAAREEAIAQLLEVIAEKSERVTELEDTIARLKAAREEDLRIDARRAVDDAKRDARLKAVEDRLVDGATPRVIERVSPQVQADAASATKEIQDKEREHNRWKERIKWIAIVLVAAAQAWIYIQKVIDAPDTPAPAPVTAPKVYGTSGLPLPNPDKPAGIP